MAKAKSKSEQRRLERTKPRSYVTLLLDRSGSMSLIKSPTIEGFNTFVLGLQKEKNADILFTFLQFDSDSVDKRIVAAPVKEVPLLTDATFQPRGSTPLIDAAYQTIKAIEGAIAREEKKPKVVVCIQTDGQENCSREHTWDELAVLVKAKQEEGWQFNFLGAGIDAYKQAAQMHIDRGSTVSYGVGLGSTRAAFSATATNSSNFSSGMSASVNYTGLQKAASGDEFDPDAKKPKGRSAS